jgi:hypothetical protein
MELHMILDLNNVTRLTREQVIRSYKPAFQLELAVCLAPCLAFALYLLTVAI